MWDLLFSSGRVRRERTDISAFVLYSRRVLIHLAHDRSAYANRAMVSIVAMRPALDQARPVQAGTDRIDWWQIFVWPPLVGTW